MTRDNIIAIISEIFKPYGFKKKGATWILEGDELIKIVQLQKSYFGARYYVNYGYIIKAIPLDGVIMHIFMGLGSIEHQINERIKELLDFENEVPDEIRKIELQEHIKSNIVNVFNTVNSEADLLDELKRKPNLNYVCQVVKKHFGLL